MNKAIKIINQKDEDIIYDIYNNTGDLIGTIQMDEGGDYLFYQDNLFCNANRLGKGKCLKEIAEFLIKLNYGKK